MPGPTQIARTADHIAKSQRTSFPRMAATVSPSDVTVFSEPSTIFVSTGGAVAVVPWDGSAGVTFTMPDGSVIPVLVKQVLGTGTTASGLVRVYEVLDQ